MRPRHGDAPEEQHNLLKLGIFQQDVIGCKSTLSSTEAEGENQKNASDDGRDAKIIEARTE